MSTSAGVYKIRTPLPNNESKSLSAHKKIRLTGMVFTLPQALFTVFQGISSSRESLLQHL